MKKSFLLPGAAAVLLIAAGCGPDLAQGNYGAEEQQWQNAISASYSGYRPPRIAPPATVDRATEEALEKQRNSQEQAKTEARQEKTDAVTELPPPAEDKQNQESAAAAVDKAAQASTADEKKGGAEKAAPAPEVKAAPKADKKADETLDHEIYVVKAGDTPGKIAQQFYGKASFYEIIMKANPQIKNPRQIQIGTKLRIPKL